MSDLAALYAAVCANPDDDTVRLVLADWFDENGQAKRAAFVRAHVALDRAADADTPAAAFYQFALSHGGERAEQLDWPDPDVAALYAAERAADRHRFRVTPKSEGAPKLRGVTFGGVRRGFFFVVCVKDGDTFARHAAAIFRAAPITDVLFQDLTTDGARAVAASGYLNRVRGLTLGYDPEPEAVRVIGAHRDAAGVRTLYLGGGDCESVLGALGGGPHWTGLRKLDVVDFFDDEGHSVAADAAFAELFGRKAFRKLESLAAWGNGLGDQTARAIAAGPFTRLRYLDLSMNRVTAAGAEALANSKQLGALRHLDLSSNEIRRGRGAGALIASPHLASLTTLRLEGNQFCGLGPKALPAQTRGPTLRALQLDGCNLWPGGAKRLFACPAVHGLWSLDLGCTDLDDSAVRALVRSNLGRLVALSLNGNAITPVGVKLLADSDLAGRLQWLNLGGIKLGPGAAALVESTKLTNLKHLVASGRGLARLRKRFGMSVVVEL